MSIFLTSDFDQHELVAFCSDEETGLKAIIAIHNTNRGPALGGCRFWNYESEEAAVKDVLRLSRGMTYKSALAGLSLGGGKAVIIGDSFKDKTPEMMRAFGRFVERFNGYYISAEDVGTSPQDMAEIRKETSHVVGLENTVGGSGDPSIMTAYGVYEGIRASAKYRYGVESLKGLRIALQGLGHVGMYLADYLHKDGAQLIVTDINGENVAAAVKRFGAHAVKINDIYSADCDVFSPCALGGILNDTTIEQLKCQIIAGAANNQLLERRHGDLLRENGILYAPDYLINAGGLINVTYEGPGYDSEAVKNHVKGIYDTLLEILKMAEERQISTNAASDQVAENRFRNPSLVFNGAFTKEAKKKRV